MLPNATITSTAQANSITADAAQVPKNAAAADPFAAHLQRQVAEIDAAGRRRFRRQIESAQGPVVQVAGRSMLNFCSNDYLGLANHPRLQQAMLSAAQHYGVGSGASPLVCGFSNAHADLEARIAQFTGRDRALLFNAGFQLNSSVISALLGGQGRLFSDSLNHASLIDGMRLSKQRITVYPHADMAVLKQQLMQAVAEQPDQPRLIVSDAVFSMDGDVAPLQKLAKLAAQSRSWLLVDDAHGIGVHGPQGRGTLASLGLTQDDVQLLVGTFGKSFGGSGAFIAGSDAAIEALLQTSRGLIFSTAAPAVLAVSMHESIDLVQQSDDRRQHLQQLIQQFRLGAAERGIELLDSNTPIQGLVLGAEAKAMAVSEQLWQQGIWISAIRPPTVPVGTARLRITLSAGHSAQQVEQLLQALLISLQKVA